MCTEAEKRRRGRWPHTRPVRVAFAHDALLDMEPGADLAAPGGAVTLAVCGACDHPPPCPVAPHHTRADRRADGVAVRVLFATEEAREPEVRGWISEALAAGFCDGPDGIRTHWTLRSSAPAAVTEPERVHAARLINS
jgi:hypothetical protein